MTLIRGIWHQKHVDPVFSIAFLVISSNLFTSKEDIKLFPFSISHASDIPARPGLGLRHDDGENLAHSYKNKDDHIIFFTDLQTPGNS